MQSILNFIQTNYLFFSIITLILVLALIGYIVEKSRNKDIKIKHKPLDAEEEFLD